MLHIAGCDQIVKAIPVRIDVGDGQRLATSPEHLGRVESSIPFSPENLHAGVSGSRQCDGHVEELVMVVIADDDRSWLPSHGNGLGFPKPCISFCQMDHHLMVTLRHCQVGKTVPIEIARNQVDGNFTGMKKLSGIAEAPSHRIQINLYVLVGIIKNRQIRITVPIEIPGSEADGVPSRFENNLILKRTIPISLEVRKRMIPAVGHDQVQVSVPVKIFGDHERWFGARLMDKTESKNRGLFFSGLRWRTSECKSGQEEKKQEKRNFTHQDLLNIHDRRRYMRPPCRVSQENL